MKNKRLIVILAAAAALLLVPFVAMQFTSEVKWSGFDFAVMGVLLLGMGLLCELVLRKVTRPASRLALCAVIAGVFVLV